VLPGETGPARLRDLAKHRALQDAESEPWSASEAKAFEHDCERAPTTPFELQQLLERRIRAINHDLSHGDFDRGRPFKLLPDETAVQNWAASRLRDLQKLSYSLDREVSRAGEKKPDIVARAKASDASVAIEIKIVDDMTITGLESALATQLCGRYLRAEGGRHGILLVVYQHRRPIGWRDPETQEAMGFDQVIERLTENARGIAGRSNDGPQPVVAVLNVSALPESHAVRLN